MENELFAILTGLAGANVRFVVVGRFAEAYARASFVALGGARVPVLSIPDLVALKRQVARPKDIEDANALEEIARMRSESNR